MIKKILFLVILIPFLGQSQPCLYFKELGNASQIRINQVAIESFGNVGSVGQFTGNLKVQGEPLAAQGQQGFISMFDAKGNLKWIQASSAVGGLVWNSITPDGFGNWYTLGKFSGRIEWIKDNQKSIPDGLLLAKWDSEGNLLWWQNLAVDGFATPVSLSADGEGSCYLAGMFQGKLSFQGKNIEQNYSTDIWIAKTSSSGTLIWINKAGGNSEDSLISMSATINGNFYLAGHTNGEATFGKYKLKDDSVTHHFVAGGDLNGKMLWVKSLPLLQKQTLGQNGEISFSKSKSLSVDAQGSAWVVGVAGVASQSDTYLPGEHNQTSFAGKLNTKGDVLWIRNLTETGLSEVYCVSNSIHGNGIITGSYVSDSLVWGKKKLYKEVNKHHVLVAVDQYGEPLWASKIGNEKDGFTPGLGLDVASNIYLAGISFGAAKSFGCQQIENTKGGSLSFIAKLDQTPLMMQTNQDQMITVFPNPTKGIVYVSVNPKFPGKNAILSVGNSLGKLFFRETILIKDGVAKSFNMSNMAPGEYLLQVTSEKEKTYRKINVE